jgi:hypothetical protein
MRLKLHLLAVISLIILIKKLRYFLRKAEIKIGNYDENRL